MTKSRLIKDKIGTLKLAIVERKERKDYNIRKLNELKRKNEKWTRSLPKYEERVEKLKNYVFDKGEDMEKKCGTLEVYQKELKAIARIRAQQLIRYIFPIEKVEPKQYGFLSIVPIAIC